MILFPRYLTECGEFHWEAVLHELRKEAASIFYHPLGCEPERPQRVPAARPFENVLFVPGMNHLMDNLSSDLLKGLPSYGTHVQNHLEAMAAMLGVPFVRQKLAFCCFAGSGLECLFDSFTSTLSPTRWQSVLDFCEEALPLEGALRRFWSLPLFLRGVRALDAAAAKSSSTKRPSLEKIGRAFDQAVSSKFAWTYMRIITALGEAIAHIASWNEGL